MLRKGSLLSRLAALALLAAVVLVAAFLLIGPYLRAYGEYRDLAAATQAHIERFAARRKDPQRLKAELETLRRDRTSRRLYLKAKSPSRAAALLLQRVKDAVQQQSGTLVSTQIVNGKDKSPFPPVTVRVRMKVTPEALQQILHRFESQRPALFIDKLQVSARPVKRRRGAKRRFGMKVAQKQAREWEAALLTVRFDLSGYLWQDAP